MEAGAVCGWCSEPATVLGDELRTDNGFVDLSKAKKRLEGPNKFANWRRGDKFATGYYCSHWLLPTADVLTTYKVRTVQLDTHHSLRAVGDEQSQK